MFLFKTTVDSGFGRVLDVFFNSPVTFASVVLFAKHNAGGKSRSGYNVHLITVTARFRVRGPPGYGETSQTPFSHIAVLQRSA